MESIDHVIELIEASAVTDDSGVELPAPSRANDERSPTAGASSAFRSSPGRTGTITVRRWGPRQVLPSVRNDAHLLLSRTGNQILAVVQPREAAGAIEGARFVELPGTDHLAFSEGIDCLI